MGADLEELLATGWRLCDDQTFIPGPEDGPDYDPRYDPEED